MCASASRAKPILTVGLQDLGTGTQTACAIIAAERLGVPVASIRVQAGDTALSAHGPFSGGSMTLASIAPAVRAAGHDVRTQLLELAADMFEIAAEDLTLEDGEVRSVDGTLRHPLTEITGKLGNAWITGSGSRGPNPDGMAVNTWGCQIAQVAVDTATGQVRVERVVAVHDIGRVINSMGARSQVVGGIMQGLGFALMEERVVDPTTGTIVNAGLEDYKVPTDGRPARDRVRARRTSPTRTWRWASRGWASRRSSPPRRRSETPSRTPPACACGTPRTPLGGCWRRSGEDAVRVCARPSRRSRRRSCWRRAMRARWAAAPTC